jgi:hypothetical protein
MPRIDYSLFFSPLRSALAVSTAAPYRLERSMLRIDYCLFINRRSPHEQRQNNRALRCAARCCTVLRCTVLRCTVHGVCACEMPHGHRHLHAMAAVLRTAYSMRHCSCDGLGPLSVCAQWLSESTVGTDGWRMARLRAEDALRIVRVERRLGSPCDLSSV